MQGSFCPKFFSQKRRIPKLVFPKKLEFWKPFFFRIIYFFMKITRFIMHEITCTSNSPKWMRYVLSLTTFSNFFYQLSENF